MYCERNGCRRGFSFLSGTVYREAFEKALDQRTESQDFAHCTGQGVRHQHSVAWKSSVDNSVSALVSQHVPGYPKHPFCSEKQ